MAKWNNQGGSSRGTKNRTNKARDSFDIPKLKELTESNSTSFKIVKAKKPKLDYGQFGDAIWDFDTYIPDLLEEVDLSIKTPRTGTLTTTPPIYRDNDYRVTASDNIDPVAVRMEYEIIVKFAPITITILTGQAYAARNELNDSRFDRSLVLLSNLEFSLGNNAASAVNLIKLSNTTQNPIYSLYNWLLDKLSIATDTTGQSQDSTFSELSRRYAESLPVTNITFNNTQYNLFYGEGIAPLQICLSASNTALDFDSSGGEKYWNVLIPGARLAVCASNQPTDPPNPDPEYRFIILFENINGVSIGGYDAANHSDLLLPNVVTKYAINPIAPNTNSFTQLTPRIDDGYPAYRGMYYLFSWFDTDFIGDTRLRLKGRNGQVTSSLVALRYDLSNYQYIGNNYWIGNLIKADSNPILERIVDLDVEFPDGVIDSRSFVLKYKDSDIVRHWFDGTSSGTDTFDRTVASEFTPIDISIGTGSDAFIIEHKETQVGSQPAANTFKQTNATSTRYRDVNPVIRGQSGIILQTHAEIPLTEIGYNSSESFIQGGATLEEYISTRAEVARGSSIYASIVSEVVSRQASTAALATHPITIDAYIDDYLITGSSIDLSTIDIKIQYRYISAVVATNNVVAIGIQDTGYYHYTEDRTEVKTYSTTPLFASLTTGRFVLISNGKIKNCTVTGHISASVSDATYIDPTLATTKIDPTFPACAVDSEDPFNPDVYYRYTCDYRFTGVDVGVPDGIKKQIVGIDYSTQSTYNHSIANYQSRIIFVGNDYFTPDNCVLAKTNQSGLIARIYKSKQVSSTEAMVEDWAIHSSGWVELTSIKQLPIGEFAGSLSGIYYYPGT